MLVLHVNIFQHNIFGKVNREIADDDFCVQFGFEISLDFLSSKILYKGSLKKEQKNNTQQQENEENPESDSGDATNDSFEPGWRAFIHNTNS